MKLVSKGTAPVVIEGTGVPVGTVVASNFTSSYFWTDEGNYEEEIECGY